MSAIKIFFLQTQVGFKLIHQREKNLSLYKVHIVTTVKTQLLFLKNTFIIMCLCERLITNRLKDSCSRNGRQERYTLFYGIQSPFSQFHHPKFTIDGVMYRCAERYMMYCKAIAFKDCITARKIMEVKDPKVMKRLGRKVRNFNKDGWQNPKPLLEKLH